MRFDSFITALDMGRCEDQLQREVLLDIALMFMSVDGVIDSEEKAELANWLATIPWTGHVDAKDYSDSMLLKCQRAIAEGQVEDFLAHRAKQLIDKSAKTQALSLAEKISAADGIIDERELAAVNMLRQNLTF